MCVCGGGLEEGGQVANTKSEEELSKQSIPENNK